jgi:hypothetical protein
VPAILESIDIYAHKPFNADQ